MLGFKHDRSAVRYRYFYLLRCTFRNWKAVVITDRQRCDLIFERSAIPLLINVMRSCFLYWCQQFKEQHAFKQQVQLITTRWQHILLYQSIDQWINYTHRHRHLKHQLISSIQHDQHRMSTHFFMLWQRMFHQKRLQKQHLREQLTAASRVIHYNILKHSFYIWRQRFHQFLYSHNQEYRAIQHQQQRWYKIVWQAWKKYIVSVCSWRCCVHIIVYFTFVCYVCLFLLIESSMCS